MDFEVERTVITGIVPMGSVATDCLDKVSLIVLINDWSLWVITSEGMKTGFGWVQAKPACNMAPLAVTPDEMEGHVRVELKHHRFGDLPTTEMDFGFHELIAHAARMHKLCPGTIVGSRTVYSSDYRNSCACCVSERRAIEMITDEKPATPFLMFGDRIRIGDFVGATSQSAFGSIDRRTVLASTS